MSSLKQKAMHKIKKNGLWSRNFTIIIIGTIISAVGETALDFAMSFSVFDETSSTWLAGVFAAVSLIPSIVIPVLAAPLVDRCSRKRIIVLMDSINSVLFLMFFVFMHYRGFNYNAYIIFQLVTGCAGSFYYLAYSALYPLLIPKGYTQKDYAVSGMIYPMVTAVMAPCSAIIYSALGLELIVLSEAILLGVAAFFESRITISGKPAIIKNHHTVALNQANDQPDTEQQSADGDGLWQAVSSKSYACPCQCRQQYNDAGGDACCQYGCWCTGRNYGLSLCLHTSRQRLSRIFCDISP